MKTTYSVKGMHCGSCVGKVGNALSHVPGVTKVNVILKEEVAEVESTDTLSLESLSQALSGVGKYTIAPATRGSALSAQVKKLRTFLPLIIIFSLVILWTLVRQYQNGVNLMDAMLDFMGGFFLLFGGLNLVLGGLFEVLDVVLVEHRASQDRRRDGGPTLQQLQLTQALLQKHIDPLHHTVHHHLFKTLRQGRLRRLARRGGHGLGCVHHCGRLRWQLRGRHDNR